MEVSDIQKHIKSRFAFQAKHSAEQQAHGLQLTQRNIFVDVSASIHLEVCQLLFAFLSDCFPCTYGQCTRLSHSMEAGQIGDPNGRLSLWWADKLPLIDARY